MGAVRSSRPEGVGIVRRILTGSFGATEAFAVHDQSGAESACEVEEKMKISLCLRMDAMLRRGGSGVYFGVPTGSQSL